MCSPCVYDAVAVAAGRLAGVDAGEVVVAAEVRVEVDGGGDAGAAGKLEAAGVPVELEPLPSELPPGG